MPEIDPKSAVVFSNQLRAARLKVLADAEAFEEVCHAIEEVGRHLTKEKLADIGEYGNLGKYREPLSEFVREYGALAGRTDDDLNCMLLPSFEKAYTWVKDARNDAVHTGAFARHLTGHAITLAIILEDALGQKLKPVVSEFMASNPVCVEAWQPVGFVRNQMLANSFSCLPALFEDGWHIVTGRDIVAYLRTGSEALDRKIATNQRTQLLAKPLGESLPGIPKAVSVKASDSIVVALGELSKTPLLLVENPGCKERILGVLTQFDLL
jgi:CBS domain-containing protein